MSFLRLRETLKKDQSKTIRHKPVYEWKFNISVYATKDVQQSVDEAVKDSLQQTFDFLKIDEPPYKVKKIEDPEKKEVKSKEEDIHKTTYSDCLSQEISSSNQQTMVDRKDEFEVTLLGKLNEKGKWKLKKSNESDESSKWLFVQQA